MIRLRLLNLRLPVGTGRVGIGTEDVRGIVRGNINRRRAVDGRYRRVAVTMMLELGMRQRLAIVWERLWRQPRLVLWRVHWQVRITTGRRITARWRRPWSDTRQERLDIIWGRHFCHSPLAWGGARKRGPNQISHKLSFENSSGEKATTNCAVGRGGMEKLLRIRECSKNTND